MVSSLLGVWEWSGDWMTFVLHGRVPRSPFKEGLRGQEQGSRKYTNAGMDGLEEQFLAGLFQKVHGKWA